MLRTVVLTVVAATAVASATAAAGPAPLLGVAGGQLVRLDGRTLEPLSGPRIAVGSGGCAARDGGSACWAVPPWAFSPDRSLVAVARNDALVLSLRLVDVAGMRLVADIPLAKEGQIGAIAWPTRTRILAVEDTGTERQRLVVVDVAKRRVVTRRALGGSVLRIDSTPRSLVLLVAPAQAIGAARIAVADSSGTMRVVRLDRIAAGSKVGAQHSIERHLPGLAIDPLGARAFVVGQNVIADVELSTLAVSYHEPVRTLANRAKTISGYSRSAAWLGNGGLAVSGADYEGLPKPSGLVLVDTGTWSARTIDSEATSFLVERGLLLVGLDDGLTAYGFDGAKRFQLFAGDPAWIELVHDGLAYVQTSRGEQIVDLGAGRVIGDRKQPLPWLMVERSSGWWG